MTEQNVVRWDEKRALCEAYRDRPPPQSSLDEEERQRAEQRQDADYSRRISAAFYELWETISCTIPKKSQQPKLTSMSYSPEKSCRLQIAENFQEWNKNADPGWVENTSHSGRIDVFCDLLNETTAFHFTNSFEYRHGRPIGIPITKEDTKGTVRNAKEKISSVPKEYKPFAHSTKATCVCSCTDCTTNPNCECSLSAKVINKGYVRLKDNNVRMDESLEKINHEDIAHVAMGCGQACGCYQHRKCDRNVDLLHLKMPKLEIFRRDPILNFGVRTLNSLMPGDVVCEFTGKLESLDQVKENRRLVDYAFQLVFDDHLDCLTEDFIQEMEKNADYQQFRSLYNDLRTFAEEQKKEESSSLAHISPYCVGNVAMFVSHGCLPNLLVVRVMANHALPQFHRLFYVAARHIAAGEELFISYGGDYFKTIKKCLCRTPLCLSGTNRGFALRLSTREKAANYLQSTFLPHCREQAIRRDEEICRWRAEWSSDDSEGKDIEKIPAAQRESEKTREDNLLLRRELVRRAETAKMDMKKAMKKQKDTSSVSESDVVDYFSQVKIKREPGEVVAVFDTRVVDLEDPAVSTEQQACQDVSLCIKKEPTSPTVIGKPSPASKKNEHATTEKPPATVLQRTMVVAPCSSTETSDDEIKRTRLPAKTKREHTKTEKSPALTAQRRTTIVTPSVSDNETSEAGIRRLPRIKNKMKGAANSRNTPSMRGRSAKRKRSPEDKTLTMEKENNGIAEERRVLETVGIPSLSSAAVLASYKIPKKTAKQDSGMERAHESGERDEVWLPKAREPRSSSAPRSEVQVLEERRRTVPVVRRKQKREEQRRERSPSVIVIDEEEESQSKESGLVDITTLDSGLVDITTLDSGLVDIITLD